MVMVAMFPLVVVGACGQTNASQGGASATTSTASVSPVHAYYIEAGDLPEGWEDSDPPEPGFRQMVCGVDIEPTRPMSHGAVRFGQGPIGPFLNQHVRIYDDAAAPRRVIDQLREAVPQCTEYSTKGLDNDYPEVRFMVKPLNGTDLPDGAVGWHQQAVTEEGLQVPTDMVLMARGNALVALVSHDLRDKPDPDVIDAAVKAADAKAEDASS